MSARDKRRIRVTTSNRMNQKITQERELTKGRARGWKRMHKKSKRKFKREGSKMEI